MKRLFTISLCLLPLVAMGQSVNFETQDYRSLGVYDKWEHSPFRTGKLEGNVAVVSNPDKKNNKSKMVLGFQRSRYASNIFGARIDLQEPFALSPSGKVVHVLINRPMKGRVMLVGLGKRRDRFGQSNDVEQFWVYSSTEVPAGIWADAVFHVKSAEGVEIHSLVIVPDAESTHTLTADAVAYIDDILVDQSSAPRILLHGDYPVGKGKAYRYMSDVVIDAMPGQLVVPSLIYMDKNGKKVRCYVDYAKDGVFDDDLVGEFPVGDALQFTVPENQPCGIYRMRCENDEKKGVVVDVNLRVHNDDVNVTEANRNGMVTAADGTKLNNYKVPFGESFKIKVVPAPGFSYSGIKIRHGYNLAGEPVVHGTVQYREEVIEKASMGKDNTYIIPAEFVDGDIQIEGLFVSTSK